MNEGVHRTRCCLAHGCKYADDNCPVRAGRLAQDFPCEFCDSQADLEDSVTNQTVYRVVYEIRSKPKCTCCTDENHMWETRYVEEPTQERAERTANKAWDYGGDTSEVRGVRVEYAKMTEWKEVHA